MPNRRAFVRSARAALVMVIFATTLVGASSPVATAQDQPTSDEPVGAPNELAAMQRELQATGSIDVIAMFDVNRAVGRFGGPPANRSQLSMGQVASLTLDGLRFGLPAADRAVEQPVVFDAVPAAVLTVRTSAQLEALAANSLVQSLTADQGGGTILTDGTREIVRADISWTGGFRGQGVRIAVLDTGIDTDHPDLIDALVHEACFVVRTDGTPGCPNGATSAIGPGSAEDDNGHGTIVSGIIASTGAVAPRGLAPEVEVEAIKMIDNAGVFWSSTQLTQALDYVLASRPDVDVVNISAGTSAQFTGACDSSFPAMSFAVNALRDRGVPVVSAATNTGSNTMGAPACLSNVVAVGATFDNPSFPTTYDTYATFSSISEVTDVAAPGSTIDASGLGGGVAADGFGTSFAAAAVSGCIAIFINQGYRTVTEIDARIRTSPRYVGRRGVTVPRIDCSPIVIVGRPGDIDCDGAANTADLRALLDYLVGLRVDGGECPLTSPATELRLAEADVNGDSTVALLDALLLAQQ